MKLHGRWWIRCRPSILLCFFVMANNFWCDVGICLVYVLMWWLDIAYVYGCKYLHELCYKSPISGMVSFNYSCHVVMLPCWFAFQQGDHCKYCIKLCYIAQWVVCFLFSRVAEVYVWLNTEDGVPQGGGFYNRPGENSM